MPYLFDGELEILEAQIHEVVMRLNDIKYRPTAKDARDQLIRIEAKIHSWRFPEVRKGR